VIAPRFVPLVLRQIVRRRIRSALTVLGVAVSMFLFSAIEAMHGGVREATEETGADTALIVYRQDRFCPATSALPEDYASRIARIAGVRSVQPMKIVVTNCRTSLDVVTFRGVQKESFLAEVAQRLQVIDGDTASWLRRSDAALVGEQLARRRGLRNGDRFDAAGVTVQVAGIIRSPDAQDENVAYTDLAFLQQASRTGLGVVTQFAVRVEEPAQLEPVSRAIDAEFARAQAPTATFSEKAFIGRAAVEITELVRFARWIGLGCLAAVLVLIANAIILSVQDRVAEHALLQTLGYRGMLIGRLIVVEGAVLALLGGMVGAGAAIAAANLSGLALSVEGVSIRIAAGPELLGVALAICGSIGVLSGLVPAIHTARRDPAASFRAA